MSKKPVGAAAIIVDSENRVLLVKHNYGKYNWEIPGGFPNKTSLRRKLREEKY
ncbi:NUDIX hydrolase [Paenibacillus sp. FSL A5-0031]|uniref:NUDIX hydrolase n=1 Tax=Paenibacillus sp. FSL A5-0031 TaxID=1920420 RepID=UPI001186C921|nr:NUDIX domain-containing protein [Paenibacillus sp. FSL A5-0031]